MVYMDERVSRYVVAPIMVLTGDSSSYTHHGGSPVVTVDTVLEIYTP